ncbi:MAG TPA: sensor histidine kinase [Brevefilum sp.]|nr:sensor histidine kinase [Brevefilum sp.]
MSDPDRPAMKKSNWRGFTLQLFLITILPLTVLLLVVAFGSQTLHHEAMRSLVGDRDLRTVRATSSSIERELIHLTSTIQLIAREMGNQPDFSSIRFTTDEIASTFEGGIALYTRDGDLIRASKTGLDWSAIPALFPDPFTTPAPNDSIPVYSNLITPSGTTQSYIFLATPTESGNVLVGAFSPKNLIEITIGDLANSGQVTILVISAKETKGDFDVLYRTGPSKMDKYVQSHPGITEALNGESGINYYQGSEGEHVVAFTPIYPVGWGLVIEEAWEDIASPYLISTQSAPLILAPVFILAIFTIWFGARRIVTPLQKLEKQAAGLARGNFDAIRQQVGGIEEIRNLQLELIDMADKLKTAQQSLRSYIGAITAGVENERRSLARELHDDTIQALIALNQRLQLISINSPEAQKGSLSELQTLVQQAMTNLRRMIRGLRPIYLEDLGVVNSLEMLVQEMGQTANIPIAYKVRGQERGMDTQKAMSVYRIVQESLNNVIRHAEAKHAWVELDFAVSEVFVQIRDDGKGFVVPANPAEFPEKGHFGLLGLQERAEIINAELKILSTPGQGTIITLQVK